MHAMVGGIIAMTLLAGCSTRPVRPTEATPGEIVAFATPDEGTVPVTVTRDAGYTGSGCSVEVTVEGERVGRLWSRETITMHLPQGETIIGVRPAGMCGLGQSARGMRELEVNIRPSRPLFFRVGYDINQMVEFSRTGLR